MQQVARPTKPYSTTVPDALVVARDPVAFVPPSILLPAIAGTSKHFTFIYLTRTLGNTMLGASIAGIIIQYENDVTPQLIKRCLAPKIEAVDFLNGKCATYWYSGMPADVLPNGVVLPKYIQLPATFSRIYEMLNELQEWMNISIELGVAEPEVQQTFENCEKLKRVVLAGQTKLWEMSPTFIKIEGTKSFTMVFSNFWIQYEKFLDEFFDE